MTFISLVCFTIIFAIAPFIPTMLGCKTPNFIKVLLIIGLCWNTSVLTAKFYEGSPSKYLYSSNGIYKVKSTFKENQVLYICVEKISNPGRFIFYSVPYDNIGHDFTSNSKMCVIDDTGLHSYNNE